jgi:hypothetical protein
MPVQPPQSQQQTRNLARARRNWSEVEQYLTKVEKADGYRRAWELRERFERGQITLADLPRRS